MEKAGVRVHQAFLSRLERCTVTPRCNPVFVLSHDCKEKICFKVVAKMGKVRSAEGRKAREIRVERESERRTVGAGGIWLGGNRQTRLGTTQCGYISFEQVAEGESWLEVVEVSSLLSSSRHSRLSITLTCWNLISVDPPPRSFPQRRRSSDGFRRLLISADTVLRHMGNLIPMTNAGKSPFQCNPASF